VAPHWRGIYDDKALPPLLGAPASSPNPWLAPNRRFIYGDRTHRDDHRKQADLSFPIRLHCPSGRQSTRSGHIPVTALFGRQPETHWLAPAFFETSSALDPSFSPLGTR
jgi:hypothetical protein